MMLLHSTTEGVSSSFAMRSDAKRCQEVLAMGTGRLLVEPVI